MIFEFELLLVIGALAFYLQDSCALLFADEFMLERVGRCWRAQSGSSALISGKRPFMPNPLAPYRPLLRVSLDDLLGHAPPARRNLGHFLGALVPFKVLATFLLILFFPGLPLVLYQFGTGVELLYWFAVVYLAIACIAVFAFRRRRVLELSPRDCAVLAFECFCCAPFAINIVRKLTVRSEAVTLDRCRSIFDAQSQRSLLVTVGGLIDEMQSAWDVGSPQADTLVRYRESLAMGSRER